MTLGEFEVLSRILDFRLHVCHLSLDVHVYHGGFRRWVKKVPDIHPISRRYRFRFGKIRSTVYRNRLVWMYFNRRAIPETFIVDHVDCDNTNDHPSNLRLMSDGDSRRQGYDIQGGTGWRSWQLLMEYVDFMGHWPPDGHVLWE